MAITVQPTQSSSWRRVVAELPFIPVAADWLELLASLLAQPLMFVSSLYIIAETVTPSLSWSLLDGTTKTVMSLAPEIILPGCFQQAQQSRRDGKERKAQLLFGLCGLFGLLTLVTFASFLWHFDGGLSNFILFVRCASGVSYTIILKIDKQQRHVSAQSAQPMTAVQPLPDLAAQIREAVRTEMQAFIAQSVSTAQSNVQVLVQNAQVAAPAPTAQPKRATKPAQTKVTEIAQIPEARTAQTDPALPTVHTLTAQSDEEKRKFAHGYITDYLRNHGKQPTLEQIMHSCDCAKNTAVRYRRECKEIAQ